MVLKFQFDKNYCEYIYSKKQIAKILKNISCEINIFEMMFFTN